MPPTRSPLSAGLLALGACLLTGAALAQPPRKPPPSPAAPGDLSRPAYDTRTPVYPRAGVADKSASTIVAEVEGRPITLGDLGDAIRALPSATQQLPFDALYPFVLDVLIKQQALVVRAQQQGLDEESAARRHMRQASDKVLSDEYLRREIEKGITEQDLLARYQADFAGRNGPDEVHLRLILVPAEKDAVSAIEALRAGGDFATMARRLSHDSTARVGGDLGFVTRDGLQAEVGAVAFAARPGDLVPYPVRAASGWFVVRVEERRARPAPPYAEARPALFDAMARERVAATSEQALRGLTVRRYTLSGKEAGTASDEVPGDDGGGN